ncbi:MAG: hypothetical protein PHP63_07555 [Candidatus Marinimicrobia bacterium]|jgi:hypothetical protein|nr:hypothetical protein [Candidatus Neomarinimicrobiota bacterium]
MPIKRVVIYGYVFRGHTHSQEYALVDLVYFVDDPDNRITAQSIFNLIEGGGFRILPKRIGGKYSPVEQDKVTVEDWTPNIKRNMTVGVEQVPNKDPDARL